MMEHIQWIFSGIGTQILGIISIERLDLVTLSGLPFIKFNHDGELFTLPVTM